MSACLDLRIKRPVVPVPPADWNWKSEAAVIGYMITRSGIGEKAIAVEIGVDPSTLAKAKQGTARLPEEAIQRLMDCTGSEAWLIYQLLRRNKDPHSLRVLETENERQLREKQERIEQLERDKLVLIEAMTGRTA